MDKMLFTTRIRGEHKLAHLDYVRGRISGMMCILCKENLNSGFAIIGNDAGDYLLKTECYLEDYSVFAITVEAAYPGLCDFYYKVEIGEES